MEKRKKEKEEKVSEHKKEKEEYKKEESSTQNRELRKILVIIGGVIIIFLIGFVIIDSIRHFKYQGVDWDVVKEGNIILYRTVFPFYSGITGKHVADYNVYIRNDPRKLKDTKFDGEMNILDNIVINSTENFHCDGDGIIAIANVVNTFNSLGINTLKDEKGSCDSQGGYMFVQIQPGNITSIEQFGPACYNLNVDNCEILKVTERFLVEAIVKLNE